MTTRYGVSIGRVLHPTDFSHGSEVAFYHALRITCATKGSLSILHVDQERRHPDWDRYPCVRETLSRWQMLPPNSAREDVGHLGIRVSKASVSENDPADGVLHHLEHHPADMLVLASHQRHGLDRWLHSTVSGRINNQTDGATLFLPYGCDGFVNASTGRSRLRRILLPVDHDPDPSPAVEVTADLIHHLSDGPCEVRVLHVGDPAALPTLRLPSEPLANWKWVSRSGSTVNTILREAEEQEVDMIAMTTSGRHGLLDALRGSTTEQIVENARCPILAVHAWID